MNEALAEKISTEIYTIVNELGFMTFADIERIFQQNGFEYKGTIDLFVPKLPNVVCWSNWNQEAVQILQSVLKKQGVCLRPVNPMLYETLGVKAPLPICDNPNGYADDDLHWLPVVVHIDENRR